jgi:LEA14-like dessication related protein
MRKSIARCPAAGFLLVLMALILSLGGSSCRTQGAVFRGPSVSLHSVDITGLSLKGVDLVCRLNVENPNPFPIPFPEIGWEFFIDANSFISGLVENGKALKAQGLTVVNVPVSLSYEGILNSFKSLKGRGELNYSIDLETRFLLPILGERLWHFEYKGKIPLLRMIAFRNPSLRIEKLDFEGADIICSLDIDNPNPFPLPFPEIAYNYAVRNSVFVTGTSAFPGSLAAGALTPVEIRLRIVYADLYRDFSALRAVGEAAALFSLASRISLPGFGEERFTADIPGSLPLLKIPTLSFKGISVKNISLSKIEFEFGWDLDNPNGFGFGVEGIEYSFVVNNNSWAQGKLTAMPDIAPGRKTAIPLTVSINTPAVVKDLTDIITRGMDVSYELKGTVTYGSNLRGFSGSAIPFNFSGRTKLFR